MAGPVRSHNNASVLALLPPQQQHLRRDRTCPFPHLCQATSLACTWPLAARLLVYQVEFSSNEACEAARLQLIKDAERIRRSMIDGATAQDRQIGSNNKTALLMAAISNAPYVSAVCVQTSAS